MDEQKCQSQSIDFDGEEACGYTNISQELEFNKFEINSSFVNWNLNCIESGNLVRIKKENVSYDVIKLDNSSTEHKILAEIKFEMSQSRDASSENIVEPLEDILRYSKNQLSDIVNSISIPSLVGHISEKGA